MNTRYTVKKPDVCTRDSKTRIRLSFYSFTLILLFGQSISGPESFAQILPPKPNIVILYADDMGFGDLNVQNPSSKIPTPNLDRLANQGIRFTDAHSSSGICTPSRYALLTGRYHWRDFHKIVGPFGEPPFKKGIQTLPSFLQSQGYHTACIGKWHLGFDWHSIKRPDVQQVKKRGRSFYRHDSFNWEKSISGGPLDRGFSFFFGNTAINMPPYCWIKNDRVLNHPDKDLDTTNWPKPSEGHWEFRPGPTFSGYDPYNCLERITKEGIRYIKSRAEKKKPFFLYLPLPSPHAPIIPTKKFQGSSEAGAYGDYVCQTDDSCGRILKTLKDAGVDENTIVIFSSDNGPEIYAYQREKKFEHWSSRPLRGLKRDNFEGGHRVPMIIRWPGKTPKGKACHSLVSQVDIFATIAEILKQKIPENQALDSRSFLNCFQNPEAAARTTLIHNTFKGKYALRHKNWLYVERGGYGSRQNKQWEKRNGYLDTEDSVNHSDLLFNLDLDIGQKNDLSKQMPGMKTTLRKLLKKLLKKSAFKSAS